MHRTLKALVKNYGVYSDLTKSGPLSKLKPLCDTIYFVKQKTE